MFYIKIKKKENKQTHCGSRNSECTVSESIMTIDSHNTVSPDDCTRLSLSPVLKVKLWVHTPSNSLINSWLLKKAAKIERVKHES